VIDKKYLIRLGSSITEALMALEESSPVNTVIVISGVNSKVEGVLTDGDIRRCLIDGGSTADQVETCFNRSFVSVDASASKEQVLKLFDTGKYKLLPVVDDKGCVLDIITIDLLSEIYSKKSHSYVRSMAPVRVSFGGGGSDMTSYFAKFDGAVLSSTIRLYARCTLRKRSDLIINICSHDLDKSLSFPCLKKLIVDDDDFGLIVAVINTIKPEFGFDLEIRSDFPIGSGLGGSSAVCVAILGCFNEYREEKWDNYQIAELSFQAERLNLGIAGGWQDQYASAFGGFNYIEFNQKQNIVHPLRVNGSVIRELEHRCLLCHTAINRESHSIQETVISKFTKDEQKDKVEMLQNTQAIKNVLLRGNIDEFGSLLNENWQLKKKFSPSASNADLEAIYETALLNGASGGKLLGAGGGGYFLFVAKVNNRFSLQKALEDVGLSVHNFEFEERGLQTWKLYNNNTDITI
jgi:D-glycero-alpha-D-manno-heptose-7-phosphate kinase